MTTGAATSKIIFLDAATVGTGDLDLSRFEAFGAFTAHDTTTPKQTIERIRDAHIVLTNKVILDRPILEACESLRLICVCATGVNNIDLETARKRGITVCNVSGYSTPTVCQHTVALLLNLATNAHRHAAELSQWPSSPIFTRLTHQVVELAGKTLGIVGAGDIGTRVGLAAAALGMNIQTFARDNQAQTTPQGWPRVPLNEFFAISDAISLHCPLTDDTRHLVNAETLALMKPGSFLVNTGRGELIVEDALANALRSGQLGGAALDVLSVEPPSPDHPLLAPDIPNLLVTPHTAWISLEARERLLDGVLANIHAFLSGAPRNVVT
jgi:glycerate dehydrogenase